MSQGGRHAAAAVMLVAAPPVGAAEGLPWSGPSPGLGPQLVQVTATLAVMLGVLILALYLWRRFGPTQQRASPLIEVLGTYYLAPKKALILVGIGQERFLLASTAEHLTLLTPVAPWVGGPAADAPAPAGRLPVCGACRPNHDYPHGLSPVGHAVVPAPGHAAAPPPEGNP